MTDPTPARPPKRALLEAAEHTFGGHTATEVAELCEMLANSADRLHLNYTETAAIARRAASAIRYLLGEAVSNADAI